MRQNSENDTSFSTKILFKAIFGRKKKKNVLMESNFVRRPGVRKNTPLISRCSTTASKRANKSHSKLQTTRELNFKKGTNKI